MTEKPTLVLLRRAAGFAVPLLEKNLKTDWQIEMWHPDDDPARLNALAPSVDVLCGGVVKPEWPDMPRLKLYQIPFTGYDWLKTEDLQNGVQVCNTFEHETAIAEYIMCAMLEWQIGFMRRADRFKKVGWESRGVGGGNLHGEVLGKTVGIVGYGHIGREVAVRANAFGMRVIGNARSAKECPPELDWLGTAKDLPRLLAESDFVIIACPLNEETRSLMGHEQFGMMKDDGVLINVGRGEVVDEEALYRACAAKTIQGAVIDVWYQYLDKHGTERPSVFPIHHLDNIIMTPHNSGWTMPMWERRWQFVSANLDRLARGEPLQNTCAVGSRKRSET